MSLETSEHTLRIFSHQIAATDDHHVQSLQQPLVTPKALTDKTFDAIALDRPPDLLTRDCEPQSRRPAPATSCQHGQCFAAGFLCALEYALVISGSQQTHVPLEL